jgi:thymidine phosphorylase
VAEGRLRAEAAVADGSAEAVWCRWIEAQGGTADEAAIERAPVVREVTASRAGAVVRLGAIEVATAALHLGAGRRTKDDPVDHAVGVVCHRKRGDTVAAGDVLAEVHARDDAGAAQAASEVLAAYEFGDESPAPRPVLLEVLGWTEQAPAADLHSRA